MIVDLNESSTQTVDDLAAASGGLLLRYNYDELLGEIIDSEEAAKAAQKEANRVLREQKKADRKADLEKRWDAFKAKFKQDV